MGAYRARQRRAGQRRRQRRGRRQGHLRLRADLHPLLPGRGADPAQRRHVSVLASRDQLRYVLEHLAELVVKPVGESGGYGMLIGPDGRPRRRSTEFRRATRRPIRATTSRSRWCALSRVPVLRPADGAAGRPARRPAALLPLRRREGHDRARRPHARRAARGLAGRELVAGRRQQGHLGAAAGRTDAVAHRRFALLDRPLHRARRGHRAHPRRQLPHAARGRRSRRYRLRWEPLVVIAGEHERVLRQLLPRPTPRSGVRVPRLPRRAIPNSIVQCVTKARENARTIRDRISREMWEDINGLYLEVSRVAARRRDRRRAAPLLRAGQVRQPPLPRA